MKKFIIPLIIFCSACNPDSTCIDNLGEFEDYANCCLTSGIGNLDWWEMEDTTAKIEISITGFVAIGATHDDNGEYIFNYLPPGNHSICVPVGIGSNAIPIFARSDCPFEIEIVSTSCVQAFHEVTGNPLCILPKTNYEFIVTGCFTNCEWRL